MNDYYSLEQLGDEMLFRIKSASWFPYKSGNLKFTATSGAMFNSSTYRIHFSSAVAPYVEALEEGSRPHDILGAFIGKEAASKMTPPFGVGGRFDGKFHPGSTKHKGFISVKCVQSIVEYIVGKYNGMAEVV